MRDDLRILVVDDEPQITKVLKTSLQSQGYDVRVANDGDAALDVFEAWTPNLVISDLAMPTMNGVELCKRLRTSSKVPILMLSVTQDEKSKVEALDAGADDYITKPFGIDELLARVRAGLRRGESVEEEVSKIQAGHFKIDLDTRQVLVRGEQVYLTPKEFDLLVYLLRNAGKVVTHRSILVQVWGKTYADQGDSLRVFVAQLRKKIEVEPSHPRYLLTEPWVGYRFESGEAE